MQKCSYCGKISTGTDLVCTGCGTPLAAAQTAPLPVARQARRSELNARSALLILAIYVAAQFACGVAASFAARKMTAPQGKQSYEAIRAKIGAAEVLAVPLICGVAVLVSSRIWLGQALQDAGPCGAAWVRSERGFLAKSVAVGLSAGLFAWTVNRASGLLLLTAPHDEVGLAALTPGLPRGIWVFSGLLLVPVVEEALFRGVLYGGLRKSAGPKTAVAATTVLFLVMHTPEILQLPSLAAGFTALSLAALWCRLRFRGVDSSICAHAAFNLVTAVTVIT